MTDPWTAYERLRRRRRRIARAAFLVGCGIVGFGVVCILWAPTSEAAAGGAILAIAGALCCKLGWDLA